jgi:hypothetical protein
VTGLDADLEENVAKVSDQTVKQDGPEDENVTQDK